jgi:hypothetical protein
MPILAFVVGPTLPWPPPDVDQGEDAAAVRRLVARVRSDHTVNELRGELAFREDLILALHPHEDAAARASAGRPKERSRRRGPSPPQFLAVPPYVGGTEFVGRADDLATLADPATDDEWLRRHPGVVGIRARAARTGSVY